MIDFHNHILPNIDDGSKSLEISLNMLREAERQGITEVVNTVHFQHPKMDGKDISFESIGKAVKELQRNLDDEEINVKIHIGSEVFFLPNLIELKKNPLCTMGNGKYMLIEFPIINFPNGYEDELFKLKLNGITPIIAHPERYREIQNNIQILSKFIDKGYVIQLDAGSVIGHFGREARACVNNIIAAGFFHLIGSDAHNDKKRNFCIEKLFEIDNPIIENYQDLIFNENPKNILNGDSISAISEYFDHEDKFSIWNRIIHKFK
jgi:protein-tyrosine phosphatase